MAVQAFPFFMAVQAFSSDGCPGFFLLNVAVQAFPGFFFIPDVDPGPVDC